MARQFFNLTRVEVVGLVVYAVALLVVNVCFFGHYIAQLKHAAQYPTVLEYPHVLDSSHPMKLFVINMAGSCDTKMNPDPTTWVQSSGPGFVVKGSAIPEALPDDWKPYARMLEASMWVAPKVTQWTPIRSWLMASWFGVSCNTAEQYVVEMPFVFVRNATSGSTSTMLRQSESERGEPTQACWWKVAMPPSSVWGGGWSPGSKCSELARGYKGQFPIETSSGLPLSSFRFSLPMMGEVSRNASTPAAEWFQMPSGHEPLPVRLFVATLGMDELAPNLTGCVVPGASNYEPNGAPQLYDLDYACVMSLVPAGVFALPESLLTFTSTVEEVPDMSFWSRVFNRQTWSLKQPRFHVEERKVVNANTAADFFDGSLLSPPGVPALPHFVFSFNEKRRKSVVEYTVPMMMSNMLAVFNFGLTVSFTLFPSHRRWPYYFVFGSRASHYDMRLQVQPGSSAAEPMC